MRAATSKPGCGAWTSAPSINGHARFLSPREVQVGDDVLTADRIFINTGGRALVPDMPGVDKVDT